MGQCIVISKKKSKQMAPTNDFLPDAKCKATAQKKATSLSKTSLLLMVMQMVHITLHLEQGRHVVMEYVKFKQK